MAQELPEYTRETQIEAPSSTPDFGDAMREYGAAQGGALSSIGASVAQGASTSLAQKWGYEMGQTPKGDLLPPITDFDKQVSDSYNAQAQATLSLQANKLILDTDEQVNSAYRLTPELIANAHEQVAKGLSSILDNAPTEVKQKLGFTFSDQLMQQSHNYQNKMIGQQKEDEGNRIIAAAGQASDIAFQQGASGNNDGAKNTVASQEAMIDAGVANRLFSPQQAYVLKQTIKDSAANGKYINQGLDAKANNKFEEWEENFAKKKPSDLDYRQWQSVGNAVTSYMGTLDTMRAHEENIRLAQFHEAVIKDPTGVSGAMIQDLQDNVSPERFANAHLMYITAMKKNQAANAGLNAVVQGFSNPDTFARASAEDKNAGFDSMVQAKFKDAQSKGLTPNLDETEAQVAATAAGAVPAFVSSINTKLASTDPSQIEAAGKQIEYMNQAGKGANLDGVTDQSLAMDNMYSALRRVLPPQEAAQQAYDAIYNQTPDQKKTVDDNWKDITSKIKSSGTNLDYYTKMAGISPKDLTDPAGFVTQASALYENYFKVTRGDAEAAKNMTQQALNSTYGESYVNGKREVTFYPLEQVVGLPRDAAPVIQSDIIDQVNKQIAPVKDQFNSGQSEYYWEVEPRVTPENMAKQIQDEQQKLLDRGFDKNSLAYQNVANQVSQQATMNNSMVIHRVWRNGTRETFPLIVKADPWLVKLNNQTKPYGGAWDVVLGTQSGWTPLQRLSPMVKEFIYYQPNVGKIKSEYSKIHGWGSWSGSVG